MKILSLSSIRSNSLFLWMFGIVCLLNIDYAILRSARNALAVADLGGGAGVIPWFELCGTMPGAILMTLALTWMLNRYPIQKVFFLTLTFFVSFFILFAFAIYPSLPLCKEAIGNLTWLPYRAAFASFVPLFASMLYFVMAELWKIALLTILFWGMINQYVPLENAKRYYGPLMLGGSCGTILAGPLIQFCTSHWASQGSWSFSLILMMGALCIIGLFIGLMFNALSKAFSLQEAPQLRASSEEKAKPLSIWEGILICVRSKYLLLLAWVTIADYIAYALGEIVFFDILKQRYPDPLDYCNFMGQIQFFSGLLTAFSALVITPYLLSRCRWVVASLVTPICLLVTEGAFFFTIWHPTLSTQLGTIVLLGSIFFCSVRAAKFTLFDTAKEISFVLLPPLEKMQGKLVVDGMCSRLGRGSGSCITLGLVQVCGGVLAAAPIAGSLALLIAFSCTIATSRLGRLVEARNIKQSA